MKLSNAIGGYLLHIAASYSQKTVRLYRSYLNKFYERIGEKELESITSTELNQYLVFLRNEYRWSWPDGIERPLGPAAVDNHWKILRSFFGWCHNTMGLPRPDLHLPRPKYQPSQIVPFTKDEIKQLLFACVWTKEANRANSRPYRQRRQTGPRDKALVLLLLDTGIRIGEASRLKVGDVDLNSGDMIIAPFGSGQKTKPRIVYLGLAAKRAMWLYLAKNEKGREEALFSENLAYLQRIIKSLGQRAGVPNCHPHRFRHTFAMEYLRNGGDPFTLQRLLGHSTLEMVQRYLNILESDKKMAHERASPADRWRL